MIDIENIQSLTDFQRNTLEHIRRLEKTGQPEVLTINGRAKLVVQDAASYRALTLRLAAFEDLRAVQRGLDDIEEGRVQNADMIFKKLDAKHFSKSRRRKK